MIEGERQKVFSPLSLVRERGEKKGRRMKERKEWTKDQEPKTKDLPPRTKDLPLNIRGARI